MTEYEAREIVERGGFIVKSFVAESNGYFCFICNGKNGETEVCVSHDGNILISPT